MTTSATGPSRSYASVHIGGGQVIGPTEMGDRDVVATGPRIVDVAQGLRPRAAQTLDARDCLVVPGIIDGHVHYLGGGGAWGPRSRGPELAEPDFLTGGITTVVGCLGYDPSRTLPALLLKARALELGGVSAYAYTGGFGHPVPTLTGDAATDIACVDRFVGVKLAVGEPAVGAITHAEYSRILASAVRGGALAGKPGVVHAHLGRDLDGVAAFLRFLYKQAQADHVVVTHANRSDEVLEQAAELGRRGGHIDLTSEQTRFTPTGARAIGSAAKQLLDAGVDSGLITVSSDAGTLVNAQASGHQPGSGGWEAVRPRGADLLRELVDAGVPLSTAVAMVTSNVARVLGLDRKGTLTAGQDADVVVLTQEFAVRHVVASGTVVVRDGEYVA